MDSFAEKGDIKSDSGEIIKYISSGNMSTPNQVDGYLFYYPRDSEKSYAITYLHEEQFLSINFIQLVFQFIHINRNNGK